MESERVLTSKMNERPVTRWRREQDEIIQGSAKVERPSSAVIRPQSKIERPTSRRGLKDDSVEYNTHGTYRSATPGRNALARPPSASIYSNRVPTAGSRLTTMSSNVGLTRLNTGLSSSTQMNTNMFDRPITQQGIAGVRPGTTRGLPMTRQIQDKRYYEGLLQLKIRELTQEISTIKRDIENQHKERATFIHLDKRAKELATELTALQGELADYNIVVDKMTSNVDKETVEQEAKELAQKNELALQEVEHMFEQRQQMEQELRRIEKELEEAKKSTERLVENMDPNTREKYDELYKQKTELQESIDKAQEELDRLCREQIRLEEHIALSPLKQEAVKLHIKIMEAERKRDKLKEEQQKRLSPEAERERLLYKIKQDNMDIAAAEAQLAEKKRQATQAEQELEQLEVEVEGNQTEKQAKYKELRKREEVMEQFMSSFEENKQEEIQKMENLEKSIIDRLETILNGMEFDVHVTVGDEMALLNDKSFCDGYEYKKQGDSLEGLKKDHSKLQQILTKMEMLERRLKTESIDLNEKIKKEQSELITLEDLDGLKAQSEVKQEELTNEREHLINEQLNCEIDLRTLREAYNKLKESLEKNEGYHDLDILEKKLEKLQEENKKIKNFIEEQKERVNYTILKEQAFTLVNKYSYVLKESLKPPY